MRFSEKILAEERGKRCAQSEVRHLTNQRQKPLQPVQEIDTRDRAISEIEPVQKRDTRANTGETGKIGCRHRVKAGERH